jgi:hypothetical protein
MRAYVEAPSTLSLAMHRVARALARYAPPGITIVRDPQMADLEVLHAIDDHPKRLAHCDYAVIQYCVYSAQDSQEGWQVLWERAKVVWSYYNLSNVMRDTTPFYLAPLGVDGEVFTGAGGGPRRARVLTSGYVSGPGAEAIEEVAEAALQTGLEVFHLGPAGIEGMKSRSESSWEAKLHISDSALSEEYGRCRWVSGLRHVEGFELPVLEGLVCGARPIVFDRKDMRLWYDDLAVFVPECSGPELIGHLAEIFSQPPRPVTLDERKKVLEKFDWARVAGDFWQRVLERERS